MLKSHAKLTLVFIILVILSINIPAEAFRSAVESSVITLEQIEADWLNQKALRNNLPLRDNDGKGNTQVDALGGCDGIINGKCGFQTDTQENPWWQVDLGKNMPLERILVYNHCENPGRASELIVLVSNDAVNFKKVYQHDGSLFLGYTDKKPLSIELSGAQARYVRLQLPAENSLHLDEIEIYTTGVSRNVAFGKAASQSSISQQQIETFKASSYKIPQVIQRGLRLAEDLGQLGINVDKELAGLKRIANTIENRANNMSEQDERDMYLKARSKIRKMAFANPLLDFDSILFVKRAPGIFPHMSDQYYSWWSRPGGGIYLLEGFKGVSPRLRCLTKDWPAGNFLRPELSNDGKRILFSYCRYYQHVADMEKVDKKKLPADAFYNVFEMTIDGSKYRQLTHGRYDDFDARYLPNDEIVFLSTRKGQFIQCDKDSAAATNFATMPDSYVRCGGDNIRPVPVFTLHVINSKGGNLRAISAFENFEWTPSVSNDGRILYARWDYIDRFNGHFMSLWSTNPDGTNPQLVYGNFTTRPQCVFEARSIPNSNKLIFTASAHHSITGGSLVLFDRRFGTEGQIPLTRLTPEVCFPETEGWMGTYYANPWPLSEDYYITAWSNRKLPPHSKVTEDALNPVNALGIYLCDKFGNLELIYRDPNISSMNPIPVRPRRKPPVIANTVDWKKEKEGRFLVQDVYQSLEGIERDSIKKLRIIGVPPKTQPHMNRPNLGVSKEDPGKFVLGTVPVEQDGSAYFRVPSGVPVFFQALDRDGFAVQTMRSLTYVQPGQTLSCIGCHESRDIAPLVDARPIAVMREPSKLTPGPSGSWPLRFDRLVQPVLDKHCVRCHQPQGRIENAANFDLTEANAYANMLNYGDKDLHKLAFEKDRSIVGQCPASQSKILSLLKSGQGHQGVKLDRESLERLVTWMDVYAQRQGSFSPNQEEALVEFRRQMAAMLAE
ncbi:MAG: HzsA-related protein [Planctomycetota bacterium]|jgi:hypothetical protein